MNMKKAAGLAALALAGYDALARPRMLGWGASRGEQHMQLPGDDIASGVPAYYTRTVTIEAPPWAVWPWLVQIGDAGLASTATTGRGNHARPARQAARARVRP
jgi:hypothetical protein